VGSGYGLFTLSLRYCPARIASLIVVMEVPIAAVLPNLGAELAQRRRGLVETRPRCR
jgi:hypothetical protein